MSGMMKVVQAALVDGEEVSLHELLRVMKLQGDLDGFKRAIGSIVIRRAAAKRGISVTDGDLQMAADATRRSSGLLRASDTLRWLREQDLSEEDFEDCIEQRVLAQKLKASLCEGKVGPYFQQHRDRFKVPALDAATTAAIEDAIWQDWLVDEVERTNARFTLPSILLNA